MLDRIALRLSSIEVEDMTQAEKQIANILVEEGYLRVKDGVALSTKLRRKVMDTVNIVETDENGLVFGLTPFPNTPEGNKDAEALFCRLVEETTDYDQEEIKALLEDGHCEVPGGGNIQFVVSTN